MNWYRKLVRNSKYRWVVLLGTVIYLVSPFDISPDVFPILGWVDDGLLATIAITEITQILIDRKRNLRQVDDSAPTPEVYGTVVDVDSVTVG
ncbi:MAG: YkvA family protein [Nodosilinea sp.]